MSRNRTSAEIMADIAAEYYQPAREVVLGYYLDDRLPLNQIAAILSVNDKTLRKWLAEWGVLRQDKGGWVRGEVIGPVMARARRLGYECLPDAVRSLRLTGHTWREIARLLGCDITHICRVCPSDAKGIVVITDERRQQLREAGRVWGQRMAARRWGRGR